jgi:hypothetical protein
MNVVISSKWACLCTYEAAHGFSDCMSTQVVAVLLCHSVVCLALRPLYSVIRLGCPNVCIFVWLLCETLVITKIHSNEWSNLKTSITKVNTKQYCIQTELYFVIEKWILTKNGTRL